MKALLQAGPHRRVSVPPEKRFLIRIYQTPRIFRQLAFPAVKRAIELAAEAGFMTHVHSCGPEAALVKIQGI